MGIWYLWTGRHAWLISHARCRRGCPRGAGVTIFFPRVNPFRPGDTRSLFPFNSATLGPGYSLRSRAPGCEQNIRMITSVTLLKCGIKGRGTQGERERERKETWQRYRGRNNAMDERGLFVRHDRLRMSVCMYL